LEKHAAGAVVKANWVPSLAHKAADDISETQGSVTLASAVLGVKSDPADRTFDEIAKRCLAMQKAPIYVKHLNSARTTCVYNLYSR
jgi:hypothetical protein